MSSMLSDDAFQSWRTEASAIDLVSFINNQRGGKLKRAGHEWVGPCPSCGGTDRFSINPNKKIFNCRGFGGGDYIKAVEHVDDCDFMAACEAMTGYKPEGLAKTARRPRQQAQARDERPEAPPAPPPAGSAPRAAQGKSGGHLDLFASGVPVMGTHAEAYLAGRALNPSRDWLVDFRFVADLPYYGYETEDADRPVGMGRFPAILAAIRNAEGAIIGVHRTYLDRDEPRKMTPPLGLKRNGVKKIMGASGGGGIWLYPPSGAVVIGEGYETTRAAELLRIGGDSASYCAAVSLGNLAGGCTGSITHPTLPKRKIPNGEPDAEKPGLILPDSVREIFILGDGDSDRPTTMGHLLAAGRRWKAEGRDVFYSLAPDGKDWNDVLQEEGVATC